MARIRPDLKEFVVLINSIYGIEMAIPAETPEQAVKVAQAHPFAQSASCFFEVVERSGGHWTYRQDGSPIFHPAMWPDLKVVMIQAETRERKEWELASFLWANEEDDQTMQKVLKALAGYLMRSITGKSPSVPSPLSEVQVLQASMGITYNIFIEEGKPNPKLDNTI